MSKVILHVVGTAQDAGLPHPNCYCENCTEAIRNPAFRRSAASLAIVLPEEKAWHLIDATPDFKEQMVRVQMKYDLQGQLMSSIFLTHAHLGHYPGILFLGREAIGANKVPVMAGTKMKKLLEEQAPWSQLTKLHNIELQKCVMAKGLLFHRMSPLHLLRSLTEMNFLRRSLFGLQGRRRKFYTFRILIDGSSGTRTFMKHVRKRIFAYLTAHFIPLKI